MIQAIAEHRRPLKRHIARGGDHLLFQVLQHRLIPTLKKVDGRIDTLLVTLCAAVSRAGCGAAPQFVTNALGGVQFSEQLQLIVETEFGFVRAIT